MEVREKNYEKLDELIDNFVKFYQEKGAIEIQPVMVSSGIDKTVRLIGSHISVMKPFIESEEISKNAMYMTQDCVRVQNSRSFKDYENVPNWASYFKSLGSLYQKGKVQEATNDLFNFLKDYVGIQEQDLMVNISSRDEDLVNACIENKLEGIMNIDTEKPDYYKHNLGMENVFGRNYNISIRNKNTGKFADVGNVIVLEDDYNEKAVEIALGSTNVAKQIYGLNNVLDCFPIYGLENKNEALQRRFEDALLVSTFLYHEGLKPNSKKGAGRNLRDYLKAIKMFSENTNLSYCQLKSSIKNLERMMFPMESSKSEEIVEQISKYR